MRCPLCAQPLDGGDLVMVCRPCHQSLGASLEVSTTGEFRVAPSQVMSPEHGAGDRHEASARGGDPDGFAGATGAGSPRGSDRVSSADVCAWCHKAEREVRKLLGRGNTALCEECISLACDILDAELGEWR
jgi:hypothetical protein